MNKKTKEPADVPKEPFKLKPKHLVIVIIGVIIISIGILASTIYLFMTPGLNSGITFAIAIVVLLITPLILAIIFYNKKLKNTEEVKPERKIITLRSDRV
ncbi:MAG: hypothetical protein FK733_10045 [Asgard group archaeon]|nr:hypothetical protein [Asgard group archaeon]